MSDRGSSGSSNRPAGGSSGAKPPVKKTPSVKTRPDPETKPESVPTDTPSKSSAQRPTQSPAQRPTQSPAEQPAQQPAQQPSQSPAQRPAQQPAQQPSQSPAQRPAPQPAQQPSQSPAQRPTQPAKPPPARPLPGPTTITAPLRATDQPPIAPVSRGAVALPGGGVPAQRIRRTRLVITRLDPWTVMRMSFLLSLAVAIITVVAVILLWALLAIAGVFSSVEVTINDVVGSGALSITQYFGFGRILTFSVVVAVIDVVLITALATMGAFLFNLAASLVGGVEVSITEEA